MKMVKGFMGRTHALLSIMLFCLCMLIPVDFFQSILGMLKENILFLIMALIVLIGGALLPDLDNGQSSAGATLGPLGSICTTFMQSISSIFWTMLHGKGDKMPPSQHRYFWHTLICCAGIICLFYFGMPTGTDTLITNIQKSEDITTWVQYNAILIFFVILIFISILVGSNMFVSKLVSIFKFSKLKYLNYVLPVLACVYVFFLDMSHLKILGICIGMGYFFHCFEDCFADTGVPFLWPIPIKNQLWKRIRLIPVTIQTGGLANTILDVIILAIDIGLIVLVILGGKL